MPKKTERPRHFFVENALPNAGYFDPPKDLKRRLTKVLRLPNGTQIILFNPQNQAVKAVWENESITIQHSLNPKPLTPLTLLIGLPKKDAMDKILRQATELGVTQITPILCEFSVPDKLNLDRAERILIEAAEQCERTCLPKIDTPITLETALKNTKNPIAWAYERGSKNTLTQNMNTLLIGPEGGFSPEEITFLKTQKHVTPFTLGNTILRTDTAAVAGLSLISDV